MSKYYGKYRGKVERNGDPQNRGRIEVKVPTVFGEDHILWAEPCVPYAGPNVGFYFIPPTGAAVWVEFVEGNRNYAIWSGCYWERNQTAPVSPTAVDQKVLKTPAGTITLSESGNNAGITIETKDGEKIFLKSGSIEITAGQGTIKINGSKVSVNDGALEVT